MKLKYLFKMSEIIAKSGIKLSDIDAENSSALGFAIIEAVISNIHKVDKELMELCSEISGKPISLETNAEEALEVIGSIKGDLVKLFTKASTLKE